MHKPTVGVFFGSRSAEHEVSIITALNTIIKPLELSQKYRVVPVYISKEGQWFSSPELKDINLFSSGKITEWLNKHPTTLLDLSHGLQLVSSNFKRTRTAIDIAFPATHGTFGEDGTLMGVFEMANIPYVGCGVTASAIAMDKVVSKELTAAAGIPTNQYFWFTSAEFVKNQADVIGVCDKLKYPLFVKPAHLGSSIAITKVANQNELINAIEVAAFYDDKIIVEEAVNNLVEVTVPIIGNDDLIAANTEEPNQGDKFFDFDTKYLKGGKKGGKLQHEQGDENKSDNAADSSQGYSHIPARLTDKLNKQCLEMAKNVYRTLGCSGIARVDLLIDSKIGKAYFNEVNPLPGSLYAHNWRTIGYSNIDLVTKLIDLAQERFNSRSKLATTFDTNFLKQFN